MALPTYGSPAQDLTSLAHQVVAMALDVARERLAITQVVANNMSNEPMEPGKTLKVPVTVPVDIVDATPKETHDAISGLVPTHVEVALSYHKKTKPIYMSDLDYVRNSIRGNVLPKQLMEAVRSLANYVGQTIYDDVYPEVYNASGRLTGAAGSEVFTAIFENDDATPTTITERKMRRDASKAALVLDELLAPQTDRFGILNPTAKEAFVSLGSFSDFELMGPNSRRIDSGLGNIHTINWMWQNYTPSHNTAAPPSDLTISGTPAKGATTVNFIKGATTFAAKKGDIVYINRDPATAVTQAATDYAKAHAITADVTVTTSATAVGITPGLRSALSGGEKITVLPKHKPHLCGSRDSIAFVTAPLPDDWGGTRFGSVIAQQTDEDSGLSMRLEIYRVNKAVGWEFDMAWGHKAVRPSWLVRACSPV